jgi:hypothetical protein
MRSKAARCACRAALRPSRAPLATSTERLRTGFCYLRRRA